MAEELFLLLQDLKERGFSLSKVNIFLDENYNPYSNVKQVRELTELYQTCDKEDWNYDIYLF